MCACVFAFLMLYAKWLFAACVLCVFAANQGAVGGGGGVSKMLPITIFYHHMQHTYYLKWLQLASLYFKRAFQCVRIEGISCKARIPIARHSKQKIYWKEDFNGQVSAHFDCSEHFSVSFFFFVLFYPSWETLILCSAYICRMGKWASSSLLCWH